MYDASDPRSALPHGGAALAGHRPVNAQYGLFYRDPPQDDDANGRTWYCRGKNFVIAYTEAKPGSVFERPDQCDEYMVLLAEPDTPATFEAGTDAVESTGYSLTIMPPGSGRVSLPNGGQMVRVFSAGSADLCAKCPNADAYGDDTGPIPAFQPWPAPADGYRIRLYSLDVPIEPGQFGRIWRCTTLMLNIPGLQQEARDITKVSPHSHDDFEQCSLGLIGRYVHHMRWKWGSDMTDWRDDVHAVVDSPSVTIIPAEVIHTSVWESDVSQLVDIFAPPRVDFSLKPGWVRNEAEYPMPGGVGQEGQA